MRAAAGAGLEVRGLMFYDAQVAGLPDSGPHIRLLKRRSDAELSDRRAAVVAAVREVADLAFVNAGGTGSLHRFAADRAVTELAAGSGLYAPTLFDGYDDFAPRPALAFALPVVRRPASGVVTAFGGGYVASGGPGWSRVPSPVRRGWSLLRTEAAGEVQTPVRGRGVDGLRLGDRVWMRGAKAGELLERFDVLHLVRGGALAGSVPDLPRRGTELRMSAWRNWAGNVEAHPSAVSQVSTVDGVVAAVRGAGARGAAVRVAGAGHSFTPLVATDGLLLRLEGLAGIVAVDRDRMRVRVLAGTTLHELNPALQALGLALPNLGDIDRQTMSGAVATGTHGTGTRRRGIADAVCGLTLVLADGSLLTCSAAEQPEVFQAARVGLGALGVVVEVELQCVPAFRLRARESGEAFSALLERIQEEADAHDHLDVHWFPHTDRALVKRNDRVPAGGRARPLPGWRRWLDDDLLANRVYEVVNRASSLAPGIVPRVNGVSARALGAREYVDDSWRVFCSTREVRFVESEYAVPRASVGEVLRELRPVDRAHTRAAALPRRGAVHRRRRHLAVHGVRAGQRLRRGAPVPPDGVPAVLRRLRADRRRARGAGRTGASCTASAPRTCAGSTPVSTTSVRCATGSTPTAASPTTTSATSSVTEARPPSGAQAAAGATT